MLRTDLAYPEERWATIGTIVACALEEVFVSLRARDGRFEERSLRKKGAPEAVSLRDGGGQA